MVIGDLTQRQMVIPKKEQETSKERNKRRIRNRLMYNDWGLYGFVQMLEYKCLRFGKALSIISERDTTKICHVCTGSWLPAVYLVCAKESICLNT